MSLNQSSPCTESQTVDAPLAGLAGHCTASLIVTGFRSSCAPACRYKLEIDGDGRQKFESFISREPRSSLLSRDDWLAASEATESGKLAELLKLGMISAWSPWVGGFHDPIPNGDYTPIVQAKSGELISALCSSTPGHVTRQTGIGRTTLPAHAMLNQAVRSSAAARHGIQGIPQPLVVAACPVMQYCILPVACTLHLSS
jgi:hypothetical protein